MAFSHTNLIHDPAWDSLLASIPGAHFEQLSGWGAVKARYGWKVHRILATHDGILVGGAQVLTRKVGRFAQIGYLCRGPAVRPGHEKVAEELVLAMEAIARAEHWLYCVCNHAYSAHSLAAILAARGYMTHPVGIPPSGLLTATCMVDLSGTEEQILLRMNSSVRRNIRRALRSPLSFHEGGESDLVRFRELMLSTCARRQSSPTPPQKDYFNHLWSELAPGGLVKLFFVKCGSEFVSAAFAFALSDTLRVWKVGWSGNHSDKDPNHLMWWEMMRWGKNQGYKWLDFVWVDTHDAERAMRGELSPEGFRDGTTYFKLGFGSVLSLTPRPQSRFIHPLLQWAYHHGGHRLLSSRGFQHFLSRHWSRAAGQ